jgi:S-adenosylmethionine:tRNA ribosyltransferase-isomerase
MTPAGDYTYDLPPELIAQDPPVTREGSRLLQVARGGDVVDERPFADLPDLLREGDLLVLNDSRVLPARLWTLREETGGQVEFLLIAPEDGADGAWRALARPSRRLRPGTTLAVCATDGLAPAGPQLTVMAVHEGGEVTVTTAPEDPATVAERWGDIPLPPYIHRDPAAADATARRARDRQRYQTVFARDDLAGAGSVAAPTAGLHFSPPLLARLAARGIATARVTLHVGPGTFRAPTAQDVARRRLHAERFECPPAVTTAVAATRAAGGRVVAVGTTSLRVLATVAGLGLPEDAAAGTERSYNASTEEPVFRGRAIREAAGWRVAGQTRLFLRPPDRITAADGLLTNFHLPQSSLLMLVAAFTGESSWRQAYRDAVARRLRFFSYGDAMLILPSDAAAPS